MTPVRYLLLADGSTDDCLLPVIAYVLRLSPALVGRDLVPDFARPGHADVGKASDGLAARIRSVVASRPFDLLFVHRDAEGMPLRDRQDEITAAAPPGLSRYVSVVPVRMSEAWLLLDPAAIRQAADHPSGRVPLSLPSLKALERLSNPKETLTKLLITASEKSGRHKTKFERSGEMAQRHRRVAHLIQDFSPLMALPAFKAFVHKTLEVVDQLEQ